MLGYLQKKTGTYIHGFDYSTKAIETAQSLFPINTEFKESIIGEIDYSEEEFDVIISRDTMYFAKDMTAFISQGKNGKIYLCSKEIVEFQSVEIFTMSIYYKKLTEKELDTFIEMRINQLREEGAKEDIDLRPALKDYYSRHMTDATFVSWLAMDGDKIVGTSGMSFVEKPPYYGCPSGKIGLLSSMYTLNDYRRKGIAKELLSRVVNEAKEYGCGAVQITASDMGVLLYSDFGFVKNGSFMQYKL